MSNCTTFTERVSSLALAAALLSPGVAAAQNARPADDQQRAVTEDGEADVGEDIVVTGTSIRGVAPVGSAVISLGRADIEASTAVTIDRVIKEIPQNFDLGVSENSRGQSGGSGNITYGNSVNLRGIGPYATLVLIDGHRVTYNSRSIDPSVLPSLGVERVEVVADGSSAIYGSDAVAGVVNLIPRRSLDGGEVFARYGIADAGDLHEFTLGGALGKVFDRGQVMVAYEHVERSRLSGNDRDFFVADQRPFGGPDGRSTRCSPGTIRTGTGASQVTYAIPANGVTQATAGQLVAGTVNRCEQLTRQDLIPRQKYDSVNGTASFDLTDWMTVSADAFYSKRTFDRRSALTSATLTVPSTNAFFVRPAGFTGPNYAVDYLFRELPANDSYGFAESWQITPKLSFKLPHDFRLDAVAGYGETHDLSQSFFGINNAALNTALASSSPATAFDPYNLGRTNPTLFATLANQIFLAPTDGKLKTYEARLNGPLFHLPGGDVKIATGYSRQDFDVALGSARGGPTTPLVFRKFGRKIDSVYGELFVPVFGAENAMAGFQRLELNAAVRYDKYSDVGSTTNPKFGVNWSPLDGLKLRGSYGTSFRAPTIPEIYGNSNNLFAQDYALPGGGTIRGVALSGANTSLKPETATTWSVGGDLDVVPHLHLGLTYFDVKYKSQVIANLSNLAILGQAPQYAGTNILFLGADAAAQYQLYLSQGIAVVGAPPANVTVFVDGRSQNLGVSITRGFDFAADYDWQLTDSDRLALNIGGTYLTKYRVAVTPVAPLLNQLNRIFNPLRFKMRSSLTWEHDQFSARIQWIHINGYKNTVASPVQSVDSFNPVDLSLSWRIGDRGATGFFEKGLTFGLEVRNLLDERPPYVNIAPSGNGSGGYDATAADPIGRVFSASVRKTF